MAILKFDEDGNYVSIYHTLTDAAKDTGIDIGNIHKCIRGVLDKISNTYFIEIENPTTEGIERIHELLIGFVKIKKIKNEKMSNLIKTSILKKRKPLVIQNVELENI